MFVKEENCPCSGPEPSQWLFLGVSVMGFDVSFGYADSPTTLTVNLVEDPYGTCEGRTKKYLNSLLQVQESVDPDPGFYGLQYNIIGAPVHFQFEDFEFSGIITTWNQQSSSTQANQWVVEVSAPILLLNSTTIILDQDIRESYYLPNIMNVYGFYEEMDQNERCESLGLSGNFRGNGIKWNTLKIGISTLAGIQNPPPRIKKYLQEGRLRYVAGLGIGHGFIPESDTGYILDVDEIPLAPSYYRLTGQSTNLADCINVLSQDFGFDWWVELIPYVSDGIVYKVCKIRIADRSIPPAPGSVESFVNDMIQTRCGVTEYMIGEEERDDSLHTVLVGPNREQIYVATWQREPFYTTVQNPVWQTSDEDEEFDFKFYRRNADGEKEEYETTIKRKKWEYAGTQPINIYDLSNDFIAPYWGIDVAGNAIQSVAVDWWGGNSPPIPSSIYEVANWNPARDAYVHFNANSSSLSDKMFFLNIPADYIELTEGELLAALSGQDDWESFISGAGSYTHIIVTVARTTLQIGAAGGSADMKQLIGNPAFYNMPANFMKPLHMISTRRMSGQGDFYEQIEGDVRTLYEWVLRYAQEFYGLKYQVRVPGICVIQDEETGNFKANFELADGFGWNEWQSSEFYDLVGIPIPSPEIDFFRGEDGRIGPIMRFEGAQNLIYDNLSTDQYGFFDPGFGGNASLWVKCETEGIVFSDYQNLSDPRVIVSLPQAIRIKSQSQWSEKVGPAGWSVNPASNLAASYGNIELKDRIDEKGNIINSTGKNHMERSAQPTQVSFALLNNDETYGPWFASNGGNVGGNVRYEQDGGLAPWNFGSYDELTNVAQQQANSTISNMYYAESGTVTMPTLPTCRPGDEIRSVDGSGYISGQYKVVGRTSTSKPSALLGQTYNNVDLITGGYWIGNLGPNVTGMTISVGESGYVTNYNITTYSPALLRKSQVRVNRLKELAVMRQEALRNG